MIVGIEMAVADRPSFSEWYPQHLESVLKIVDHLHIRVGEPFDAVVDLLPKCVTWEPQAPTTGRFFDEAAERQALLTYALASDAQWAVVFDADEVVVSGHDRLRAHMATNARLWGVDLNYVSHHRPGYVLPRCEIRCYRGFRLTDACRKFRYQGDADGLHCGSVVPYSGTRKHILDDIKVLHFHATTPAEYMAKRAFYSETTEVDKHGGIDFLYRCDRFGKDSEAIPFDEWAA